MQERLQEQVSLLADLDEQIGDAHAALEQQLLHQLHTQDLLRCFLGSSRVFRGIIQGFWAWAPLPIASMLEVKL